MKRSLALGAALLLTTASLAQDGIPLCAADLDAMPQSWRPSAEIAADLDPSAWRAEEAADARYAIAIGLSEMLNLYGENASSVPDIWEDSVGSLIELTYSGANALALDAAARDGARNNLSALIATYFERDTSDIGCADFPLTLPLALYAYKFYQPGDMRVSFTARLTEAAYAACGSFAAAIEFDYPEGLGEGDQTVDEVFDLVIWSLLFIEAQVTPSLTVPQEWIDFNPALWTFLRTYPLPGPEAFEDGAENPEFVEVAYLATHIAYIPTGNHRFPLYVEDSPELFRFHRDYFYPMLEMGELDLVAEVVDSLRQYGCTEETDKQVRDGTRYLLEVFHDGEESWMAYREPDETSPDVYDLIHKAWTGVLGVRTRAIEAAAPGTYGGVVRSWLPAPQ